MRLVLRVVPVDEGTGVVDEDEGGVDVEADRRDGILAGQDARQLQAEPVVNLNVAVVLQATMRLKIRHSSIVQIKLASGFTFG